MYSVELNNPFGGSTGGGYMATMDSMPSGTYSFSSCSQYNSCFFFPLRSIAMYFVGNLNQLEGGNNNPFALPSSSSLSNASSSTMSAPYTAASFNKANAASINIDSFALANFQLPARPPGSGGASEDRKATLNDLTLAQKSMPTSAPNVPTTAGFPSAGYSPNAPNSFGPTSAQTNTYGANPSSFGTSDYNGFGNVSAVPNNFFGSPPNTVPNSFSSTPNIPHSFGSQPAAFSSNDPFAVNSGNSSSLFPSSTPSFPSSRNNADPFGPAPSAPKSTSSFGDDPFRPSNAASTGNAFGGGSFGQDPFSSQSSDPFAAPSQSFGSSDPFSPKAKQASAHFDMPEFSDEFEAPRSVSSRYSTFGNTNEDLLSGGSRLSGRASSSASGTGGGFGINKFASVDQDDIMNGGAGGGVHKDTLSKFRQVYGGGDSNEVQSLPQVR